MVKRKSRGSNNRGSPKFRGRGGGFGRGRGRGDPPPVGFDIYDFPVQMWAEHDGTCLCFVLQPAAMPVRVQAIDDLTLLFRPATIRDSERSRKRVQGERI
jgi:hypothetical protein